MKRRIGDWATVIGVLLGVGLIYAGIHLNIGKMKEITSGLAEKKPIFEAFMDYSGILIVLGGVIAALLISVSFRKVNRVARLLLSTFYRKKYGGTNAIISRIHELGKKVDSQGAKSIQKDVQTIQDPFMQRGFELIYKKRPANEIQKILIKEKRATTRHYINDSNIIQTMGKTAPAFGMIGTLIGLIIALNVLDPKNPTTIVPAMGMAMTTTFYGVLFANLLFLPMARKLMFISEEDTMIKDLIIEGIMFVKEELADPSDSAKTKTPKDLKKLLQDYIHPSLKK